MEYETFNAARIDIQINGTSVHPGTAYGRLVNALKIANQIDAALPQAEVRKNKRLSRLLLTSQSFWTYRASRTLLHHS